MRMQFSEDSSSNYFFSQPHQPFFVLSFVNAIITMFVFSLSYNGMIHLAVTASTFHIYGLTYLVLTPAFFGFLFTTFPRFASMPAINKKQYMRIFSLLYLGAILFLLGGIVSPILSTIAFFLVFSAHFLAMLILKKIYLTSTMENKHDIFWILFSMGFGILSHFLFIVGQLFYMPLMSLSVEISVYLYLFLLTFSVAQRMVPFFSHCVVEKNEKLLKIIFALLALRVLLEGIYTNSSFIVDFTLAYLIGKEVLFWKLPFPNPNPLLWILHIALYWIPVGFLLGGIANLLSFLSDVYFLSLDIHVLLLGFILTILIGFGTRVTLGHSGNAMQADKWTTLLFYWTQVVVAIRIFVSFASALGLDIMLLFNISVAAWLSMFIFWTMKFFAILITGKKSPQ